MKNNIIYPYYNWSWGGREGGLSTSIDLPPEL
jgi:hypothetical protein